MGDNTPFPVAVHDQPQQQQPEGMEAANSSTDDSVIHEHESVVHEQEAVIHEHEAVIQEHEQPMMHAQDPTTAGGETVEAVGDPSSVDGGPSTLAVPQSQQQGRRPFGAGKIPPPTSPSPPRSLTPPPTAIGGATAGGHVIHHQQPPQYAAAQSSSNTSTASAASRPSTMATAGVVATTRSSGGESAPAGGGTSDHCYGMTFQVDHNYGGGSSSTTGDVTTAVGSNGSCGAQTVVMSPSGNNGNNGIGSTAASRPVTTPTVPGNTVSVSPGVGAVTRAPGGGMGLVRQVRPPMPPPPAHTTDETENHTEFPIIEGLATYFGEEEVGGEDRGETTGAHAGDLGQQQQPNTVLSSSVNAVPPRRHAVAPMLAARQPAGGAVYRTVSSSGRAGVPSSVDGGVPYYQRYNAAAPSGEPYSTNSNFSQGLVTIGGRTYVRHVAQGSGGGTGAYAGGGNHQTTAPYASYRRGVGGQTLVYQTRPGGGGRFRGGALVSAAAASSSPIRALRRPPVRSVHQQGIRIGGGGALMRHQPGAPFMTSTPRIAVTQHQQSAGDGGEMVFQQQTTASPIYQHGVGGAPLLAPARGGRPLMRGRGGMPLGIRGRRGGGVPNAVNTTPRIYQEPLHYRETPTTPRTAAAADTAGDADSSHVRDTVESLAKMRSSDLGPEDQVEFSKTKSALLNEIQRKYSELLDRPLATKEGSAAGTMRQPGAATPGAGAGVGPRQTQPPRFSESSLGLQQQHPRGDLLPTGGVMVVQQQPQQQMDVQSPHRTTRPLVCPSPVFAGSLQQRQMVATTPIYGQQQQQPSEQGVDQGVAQLMRARQMAVGGRAAVARIGGDRQPQQQPQHHHRSPSMSPTKEAQIMDTIERVLHQAMMSPANDEADAVAAATQAALASRRPRQRQPRAAPTPQTQQQQMHMQQQQLMQQQQMQQQQQIQQLMQGAAGIHLVQRQLSPPPPAQASPPQHHTVTAVNVDDMILPPQSAALMSPTSPRLQQQMILQQQQQQQQAAATGQFGMLQASSSPVYKRASMESPGYKMNSMSSNEKDVTGGAADESVSPGRVPHAASQELSDSDTADESTDESNSTDTEGEWAGTDYITRCLCGLQHNDEFMIACDRCEVWQHCRCMGIMDQRRVPDAYLCENCNPRELRWTPEQARQLQQKKLGKWADDKERRRSMRQRRREQKLKQRAKRREQRKWLKAVQAGLAPPQKTADVYSEISQNEYTTDAKKFIEAQGDTSGQSLLENLSESSCQSMFVAQNKQGLVATHILPPDQPLAEFRGKVWLKSEFNGRDKLGRMLPYSILYSGFTASGDMDHSAVLCVDARNKGSQARFARRSCRANTQIKHVIKDGQIHFLIMSTELIDHSTEITIPWDFDIRTSRFPLECACGVEENNDESYCPILDYNHELKEMRKDAEKKRTMARKLKARNEAERRKAAEDAARKQKQERSKASRLAKAVKERTRKAHQAQAKAVAKAAFDTKKKLAAAKKAKSAAKRGAPPPRGTIKLGLKRRAAAAPRPASPEPDVSSPSPPPSPVATRVGRKTTQTKAAEQIKKEKEVVKKEVKKEPKKEPEKVTPVVKKEPEKQAAVSASPRRTSFTKNEPASPAAVKQETTPAAAGRVGGRKTSSGGGGASTVKARVPKELRDCWQPETIELTAEAHLDDDRWMLPTERSRDMTREDRKMKQLMDSIKKKETADKKKAERRVSSEDDQKKPLSKRAAKGKAAEALKKKAPESKPKKEEKVAAAATTKTKGRPKKKPKPPPTPPSDGGRRTRQRRESSSSDDSDDDDAGGSGGGGGTGGGGPPTSGGGGGSTSGGGGGGTGTRASTAATTTARERAPPRKRWTGGGGSKRAAGSADEQKDDDERDDVESPVSTPMSGKKRWLRQAMTEQHYATTSAAGAAVSPPAAAVKVAVDEEATTTESPQRSQVDDAAAKQDVITPPLKKRRVEEADDDVKATIADAPAAPSSPSSDPVTAGDLEAAQLLAQLSRPHTAAATTAQEQPLAPPPAPVTTSSQPSASYAHTEPNADAVPAAPTQPPMVVVVQEQRPEVVPQAPVTIPIDVPCPPAPGVPSTSSAQMQFPQPVSVLQMPPMYSVFSSSADDAKELSPTAPPQDPAPRAEAQLPPEPVKRKKVSLDEYKKRKGVADSENGAGASSSRQTSLSSVAEGDWSRMGADGGGASSFIPRITPSQLLASGRSHRLSSLPDPSEIGKGDDTLEELKRRIYGKQFQQTEQRQQMVNMRLPPPPPPSRPPPSRNAASSSEERRPMSLEDRLRMEFGLTTEQQTIGAALVDPSQMDPGTSIPEIPPPPADFAAMVQTADPRLAAAAASSSSSAPLDPPVFGGYDDSLNANGYAKERSAYKGAPYPSRGYNRRPVSTTRQPSYRDLDVPSLDDDW